MSPRRPATYTESGRGPARPRRLKRKGLTAHWCSRAIKTEKSVPKKRSMTTKQLARCERNLRRCGRHRRNSARSIASEQVGPFDQQAEDVAL